MSRYDDLLLWVSEVRAGSLAGLHAAASWAIPERRSSDVLDDLSTLGHLDVAEGRWAASRTALITLANGGGNGIVVGARPKWLRDTIDLLDRADDPVLVELGDHLMENVHVEQEAPSTWYLSFGSEAPAAALEGLGIRLIDDASGALMDRMTREGAPSLSRTVRPGELVARLLLAGGDAPEWEPTRKDTEPGSYMYLRNNQRVYARRTPTGWLEMDRRWAEWLGIGASARVVWSAPRETSLYTVATVRLPLSVERALVLRTGRLPQRTRLPGDPDGLEVVRYSNIPHSMAEQVARLLRKELNYA